MSSKVMDATSDAGSAVQFEHKVYPHIEPDCCGCCGPNICQTMTLELEAEEMVVVTTNCCGEKQTQKRPYAQLGEVSKANDCCGTWFISVDGLPASDPKGLAPGAACGGNKDLVDELERELQARKIGRGNVAQIKEQEVMKQEVAFLHQKMDLILAHLNIAAPQPMVMAHRAG